MALPKGLFWKSINLNLYKKEVEFSKFREVLMNRWSKGLTHLNEALHGECELRGLEHDHQVHGLHGQRADLSTHHIHIRGSPIAMVFKRTGSLDTYRGVLVCEELREDQHALVQHLPSQKEQKSAS
jgi:hypothetical protein